ncbi:MAG: HK97 family phage prohead protease [Clostridiales bacterium]|nr:HK97 family phage prohead protease [Clostridiales bacterium]
MPIKADREYRSLTLAPTEDYVVEGDFSTYDQPYMLGSYEEPGYRVEVWEQVARGAFDETDMTDVIMQYDHQGRVFARKSNNTLEIELDETPHMRASLGGTEIGRQLFEEIKGGYTNKMSFGFTVKTDKREQTEEKRDDGSILIKTLRTITGIGKLYDVSAVSLPANDQTSISARAFSDGVSREVLEEVKEAKAREQEIKRIEARKRLELKFKLGGQTHD